MRFAREFDRLPLLAALAMLALVALAGCGGSSSKPKPPTATAPPATTKPLSVSQRDELRNTSKKFVDVTALFQSKVNRCPANKRPAACVRKAARPAEATLRSTRTTLNSLTAKTDGLCADTLDSVGEQLSSLREDLSSLTVSTQKGDFRVATRLGTNVQSGLRTFAAQSTQAQQACSG
jgi:hypothetical protein